MKKLICYFCGHLWKEVGRDRFPSAHGMGTAAGYGGGRSLSIAVHFQCSRCKEEKVGSQKWD